MKIITEKDYNSCSGSELIEYATLSRHPDTLKTLQCLMDSHMPATLANARAIGFAADASTYLRVFIRDIPTVDEPEANNLEHVASFAYSVIRALADTIACNSCTYAAECLSSGLDCTCSYTLANKANDALADVIRERIPYASLAKEIEK